LTMVLRDLTATTTTTTISVCPTWSSYFSFWEKIANFVAHLFFDFVVEAVLLETLGVTGLRYGPVV
jgi:hypothetical protein